MRIKEACTRASVGAEASAYPSTCAGTCIGTGISTRMDTRAGPYVAELIRSAAVIRAVSKIPKPVATRCCPALACICECRGGIGLRALKALPYLNRGLSNSLVSGISLERAVYNSPCFPMSMRVSTGSSRRVLKHFRCTLPRASLTTDA